MKKEKYLKMFIEDCKYYDLENIEAKTILNNINFKGKLVLDIGAGIGNLSFPLSKYAKKVIALDKDWRLGKYYIYHNKKNLKFINQSAERYIKDKKFDVILLAWPTLDYKLINLIKKSMHKDSLFVFITCSDKSDYETVIDKIESSRDFNKDMQNKKKFINILPKKFKVILNKKITTSYCFPNEAIAFRVIKNSMNLWFNTKFDKEKEKKLKDIISRHTKDKKIIFEEKIYFYILRK